METIKITISHENGSVISVDAKDEKSAQELIKNLKKMIKIINKKKQL